MFVLKSISRGDMEITKEYLRCILDLAQHDKVLEMSQYIHHNKFNCLQHCFLVSLYSYKVSKSLGLDCRSAARGGLLHDLFLYDWHCEKPCSGMHGFKHAKIALENASRFFDLNDIEKDIIRKHMWPLNLALPKYAETAVIIVIDKYCAVLEILKIAKNDIADIEKVLQLNQLKGQS